MKKRVRMKTLACFLILAAGLVILAGCTGIPSNPETDETQATSAVSPTDVTPPTLVGTPTQLEAPTGAATPTGIAAPTETGVAPTEAIEPTAEPTATGGNRVQVQLHEYVIDMPASIPAGLTVFEVTNTGTEEHSFEIEGQGIEVELEQHLQPGESATLEVDLAPGTYEVYCPVSGHAREGMHLDLTVTAP